MPAKKTLEKRHVQHHKDGNIWAKGKTIDGVPIGDWKWFRKDGTTLRSGRFENGEQVGEWITYDKTGKRYKVTRMKSKSRKRGQHQRI